MGSMHDLRFMGGKTGDGEGQKRGLRSVTMSQIAVETGIGRATLYKYSPDPEAILVAWHERHVLGQLQQLAALRDRPGSTVDHLAAVLEAYALIQHKSHAHALRSILHRDEHVAGAEQHLKDLIRDVLTEGVATGDIREDVAREELAVYCLHALGAAGRMGSEAAVRRLVAVTADCRPSLPVRETAVFYSTESSEITATPDLIVQLKDGGLSLPYKPLGASACGSSRISPTTSLPAGRRTRRSSRSAVERSLTAPSTATRKAPSKPSSPKGKMRIAPTTLAHTSRPRVGRRRMVASSIPIHSGACRGQIGPIRLAQSRRATGTLRKATS